MNSSTERPPVLASRSTVVSWIAVFGLGVPLVLLFEFLEFPAAVLVGSMIASITIAVSGGKSHPPRWLFLTAQGFVGCLIGLGVPATALGEIAANWPMLIGPIVAVTLAWAIARTGVLPGTTAV